MVKSLAFVLDWINTLNEWVGKTVNWLILALVIEVALDVILRKTTGKGLFWAFDLNYMIYGTQFMLAGAYTLKYNAHVRVDVVFNRFSPRGRAILESIFLIGLLFPAAIFLLYASWGHLVTSIAAREIGIVSAWHPPIYPYKAVIPITFALLILQGVVIVTHSLVTAVKGGEK